MNKTVEQIAQFSIKDSRAYPKYEKHLAKFVQAIEPLLDNNPPNHSNMFSMSPLKKLQGLKSLWPLMKSTTTLGEDLIKFYEIATSSATKILEQWFESEPLKATLATDGVIGAVQGPMAPGSGYVLLHHVMGELEGIKGAWGYAEGGMGAVSQAIARAAVANGAHISTSSPVNEILVENGKAIGVKLDDKSVIKARVVLSNATPKITFMDLLPKGTLTEKQDKEISRIDYSSMVAKINLALKSLPDFLADPNISNKFPMPHHQATVHLNCENISLIEEAYQDGQRGILPRRPMIEAVFPSSVDKTLAPEGCHVCHMFTQYAPYHLADGRQWNDDVKQEYLNIVLNSVEEYAPGFRNSVIGSEVLSPIDLETIFGLTGGNIFHGAMSLDQLYVARPFLSVSSPQTPINNLYLCGSGAHPGGGVMGAAGRLAALAAITHLKSC
ncbi:Pyridine nucleotide-disulfide oxidoreductase domain-containing protein 2, variant 2 [Chamberlinius hualienensis]